MTTEIIYATAGSILSILFEYIPGLSDWYNGLQNNYQKLIMLAALVVVVAGGFGLSCWGKASYFSCDEVGAWAALQALIYAVMGNQATHRILPRFK